MGRPHLSVRLDSHVLRWLDEEATKAGSTRSGVVCSLLEQAIPSEGAEPLAARLPEDLVEALGMEARLEHRTREQQLVVILEQRYETDFDRPPDGVGSNGAEGAQDRQATPRSGGGGA